MVENTPLDKVHAYEAEKAKAVLAPFRGGPGTRGAIRLRVERADMLEQAICEALVEQKIRVRIEEYSKGNRRDITET
jgi:hypothetical protein